VNFLFAIKISSDFDKVQITINYEKIKFKFVVLTIIMIILARPDTILSIVRGITRMKNAFKRTCILLESTREMCKMSIDFDISYAALSFKKYSRLHHFYSNFELKILAMIQLKNSWIGVKQQSLTHSLELKYSILSFANIPITWPLDTLSDRHFSHFYEQFTFCELFINGLKCNVTRFEKASI